MVKVNICNFKGDCDRLTITIEQKDFLVNPLSYSP